MGQNQREKRLRALWQELREDDRQTEADILSFSRQVRQHHPELISNTGVDIIDYLKNVLRGLYRTDDRQKGTPPPENVMMLKRV